jgi:CBS domain-containing protein
MKAKDVMTPNVQTCMPETSLATAAMMMWEGDCGVLPVVNVSDKVVGMITDRDICMGAATKHRDPSTIAVSEVISGDTYSCKADDDVRAALTTMKEKRVRRLPVIDEEGNLKGILSMNDVVLRARENGKKLDLSYADVIKTFQGLCAHRVPQTASAVAGT